MTTTAKLPNAMFKQPYGAQTARAALLALMAALCALPLAAQAQVYRIVGPDGKVTFSDKPPADPAAKAAPALGAGAGGSSANATGLPYELRQVAAKYPVTLYTSADCSPCGAARSMLTSRGVPFVEKTVSTNDDTQALQRLSGESVLPFATIGSQQLKGYSDSEWTQFLNAAGYPTSSVLPSSYRAPAPTPLVAVKVITPPAAPAAKAPVVPPTPVQAPANPSGIRF